jgi:hypothetical protein
LREATSDRSWLTNFEEYAETYLKIRAKNSELVPLKFNRAQQAIWKVIQRQMKQRRPVQVAVLKSRQMGISTFCQGYVFWRTVTRPNTNSLVVAHDRESTQAIFEMARVMYEELPPSMRPMIRRRNKDELLFENPDERARSARPGLRSKIEVRTAGNQEAGRGSTYHNLHLSEVSSWPEPELLATALFPTVPPIAGTATLLESTAKGGGTWWHDMYVRSKRGETGYDAVFVPWWWDPAYILTSEETREWMSRGDLDAREAELVRLYGLSKKQLAFRRKAIASYPGGLDYFMQEFPTDDEEAWLGIGTPVFDREILRMMYEKAIDVKPLFTGGISPYGDLHEDVSGPLQLWEKPQKGVDYVIGVDTAQGTEGGCDAAISVLTRGPSQKHVATWASGKHNALQLVPFVEALAWMYNEALVSIEINAAGIATQEALSRTYTRSFRWRFRDRRTPRPTERVGWQTTPTTKPLLIQHFNQMLSKQLFTTFDPELIRQAMGLAYADAGRETVIEQPGVGSDVFMATAIASYTDYLDAGYSRSERIEAIAAQRMDEARKAGDMWNPLEYDIWNPWEEVGRF